MSHDYRLADDSVVRSHWDDALERGGEMLVLAGNDVTLLSPIAAEAALAARGGITVGDLERHLLAEFGAPDEGDTESAVRALVDTLVGRGVMSVEPAE
ncbi:hypothetical protein [Demequina rhizosphaerae]|uniref:hypothetical protein n=1 Tax=Demequina rhizosphaerae TaxID=1638985 RepID=UPI000780FF79|nr:hypothetical protein [Demequina rhizosphaerae]